MLYDDSIDSFTFKEGSSLTTVSGGTPTTATHLTTKAYVDGVAGAGTVTNGLN